MLQNGQVSETLIASLPILAFKEVLLTKQPMRGFARLLHLKLPDDYPMKTIRKGRTLWPGLRPASRASDR